MPPALTEVFELGVALMLVGWASARCCKPSVRDLSVPSACTGTDASCTATPASRRTAHWKLDPRTQAAADRRGPRARRQRCAHGARARHASHDGVAISYMALFGLGSTFGMAALSGLLGWPLARFGTHLSCSRRLARRWMHVDVLGIAWGYPLISNGQFYFTLTVQLTAARWADSTCGRRTPDRPGFPTLDAIARLHGAQASAAARGGTSRCIPACSFARLEDESVFRVHQLADLDGRRGTVSVICT